MNCVCLICFKPKIEWFQFLSTFTNYDIYVIIDDNSKDYTNDFLEFNNIKIIQIPNNICTQNGFSNTCTITIFKNVSGWTKAVYAFSSIHTTYNNVWFFEDDVFFNNENTLLQIDLKHHCSDLLSNVYMENTDGEKKSWLWRKITIHIPPPYYNAMICCIRVSNKLLSSIKEYANTHKTLFFAEALFPTLCKKHNLQYETPDEFTTVHYRKNFNDVDINTHNIFHPVKDINKHIHYRTFI